MVDGRRGKERRGEEEGRKGEVEDRRGVEVEQRNKQKQLYRVTSSKHFSAYEYFTTCKSEDKHCQNEATAIFTQALFAYVICKHIQTHNIEFPLK